MNQAAVTNLHGNSLRHGCDGGIVKEHVEGEIHPELLTQLEDETGGQNGVTTNIEEVVKEVNSGEAEQRSPNVCQLGLHRVSRRGGALLLGDRKRVRERKFGAIYLAVGGQGHSREGHKDCGRGSKRKKVQVTWLSLKFEKKWEMKTLWNGVGRELGLEMLPNAGKVIFFLQRHKVRDESVLLVDVTTHHSHVLADVGVLERKKQTQIRCLVARHGVVVEDQTWLR